MIFAIVLLLLDFLYLYLTSKYTKKALNIKKINYLAIFICYLFILTGYYYFIALPKKSASYAFLLGFIIYGVYETTTYATFKKWRIQTVLLDTLWGGILFAATTYLTYKYAGKNK